MKLLSYFLISLVVLFQPVANYSALGDPTVSFDIKDYAEFGNIREKVITGYQEIRVLKSNLNDSINYSNFAEEVLSSLEIPFNISTPLTDVLSIALTLDTLNEAAKSKTLDELNNSLSSYDLSGSISKLQNIQMQLITLNSQISEPIQFPNILLASYAVAISPTARQEVSEMLNDAMTGEQSMVDVLISIGETHQILRKYIEQLRVALQTAYKLQQEFNNLAQKFPLLSYPLYNAMGSAFTLEGQIRNLTQTTYDLLPQLDAADSKISQRLIEIGQLIWTLNELLAIPPLSSTWTTSADVGGANAFYELSFSGRSFSYPGTEIDGRFQIGTLTIHNFITPGVGDTSLTANISFSLLRSVNDPVLGIQSTKSNVSMSMTYFVTKNVEENLCGPSRDYFNVPSLGVNLHICEESSRSFAVYGQYDSPLRIVAIEALPDDVDPDPSVETIKYLLDVIGGDGSGLYSQSETVTAVANVPNDQEFVRWEFNQNLAINETSEKIVFSMPSEAVTLKAILRPKREIHELIVIGGSGSGNYPSGIEVPIAADEKQGFKFSHWSGDTSSIINKEIAQSFVVVDKNIEIQAEYVEADTDTDADGIPDRNDNCPEDPDKSAPGTCGCGAADTDTDADGTPDCNDKCLNDPNKTEPGVCGCGVADTDSDGDGTPDCNDHCSDDQTRPSLANTAVECQI